MVKLLLFLFPERAKNSKLITHIVMHDAGEFLSGDGPYSAKMANPDLRLALDVIEDFQLEEFYSFFSEAEDRFLDEEDKPVVKLLDLLDSFLYQAVHDPVRTSTEFRLYSDILRRACVLNVFASVNGLIGNALYVNNIKMKEVK
jgi:5'-deoxynucleotidase YfbR-like HD superfamily hydrolase